MPWFSILSENMLKALWNGPGGAALRLGAAGGNCHLQQGLLEERVGALSGRVGREQAPGM